MEFEHCCCCPEFIGPFFFEDEQGAAVTVNGERYHAMLNEFLFPKIQFAASELWFDPVGLFLHENYYTKSKLPFTRLKPKQSKIYWKIGLIEWGTVKPAVAVIWIMLCFILRWRGSLFLIKPYFCKNIL